MQNKFTLALIAIIRPEDRCNSELLRFTSKQIMTIISQPNIHFHLSESP